MSTTCPKQTLKIKSISDLASDIIFLSDLRLNNCDSVNDVEKKILSSGTNQYKFYHNSSKNSRGVGILISTKLEYVLLDSFRDISENILGLHINIFGHPFLIISIYGQNTNVNAFFQDLYMCISQFPNSYAILGVDWNLTYSTADTPDNIDIFQMVSPPSLIRSRALSDLCDRFLLSDPYRALHPDRRDFTFRPANRRANRSHLDFFIISDRLQNHVSTCDISVELANSLFDHHYVTLKFNAKKFKDRQFINHSILNHPRLLDVATTAAAETYLQHADPDDNPGIDLPQGQVEIRNFMLILRQINELELDITLNGSAELKTHSRLGLIRELDQARDTLPTPEELSLLHLTCSNDTFLEILMGSIKGAIISFQSWIWKLSTIKYLS